MNADREVVRLDAIGRVYDAAGAMRDAGFDNGAIFKALAVSFATVAIVAGLEPENEDGLIELMGIWMRRVFERRLSLEIEMEEGTEE